MKKALVLLAVLLIGGANVFAQTEKGDFLLGAGTSLDFSFLSSQVSTDSYESDKVKNNSFEFTPCVGYFLANNLVVGIDFLTSNATEKEDGDKYKTSTFAVGPFARVYMGSTNVKPFLHAGFGFGKNTEEYNSSNAGYSDEKIKSNLTTYDVGGGVSFFLTPKVALEVGISYGNASSKYTNYYNEDATNKVKGIASSIGFSVHL
ncbi:outer membrane beta-barrel protein [uncultured Draconibacterium sp.]|uniref:outer membrane protein n=1 Tax=uncultured Draconibacterium sp. TaxID=1573823 RepID=UPI0029C6B029|nr:outer membrane beta-barrel protein [uncultured Draconibacterium sp.]